MLDLLAAGLGSECDVVTAESCEEALGRLGERKCDAVLTDLNMPDGNGLDLCRAVRARDPEAPIILVTAFGNMQSAIEAVRAGVFDFVTKPFELETIRRVVRRAVSRSGVEDETRLRGRAASAESQIHAMADELVVESPAMRAVLEMAERVAATDVTCLLTGESGVGKEVIARWIHARSARGTAPIVAVNCAAIPDALLESELFGHAKGAFTDARGARTGLLVEAGEGTVFLDELGELPRSMQAKLLRALQERTVRPVGRNHEVPFAARIIGATNKSLEGAVARGEFREDLYYRLNVLEIRIPPLRERTTDIRPLAERFLAKFTTSDQGPSLALSEDAVAVLTRYHWPGNVRELSNAIERAVALARGDRIRAGDLPPRVLASKSIATLERGLDPPMASEEAPLDTLDELERKHLARVLHSVGGNRSAAAQVLGIDRKTLYRKLNQHHARWMKAGR